jgi:protocatechuate 3,4-dioxygenase beta subunit
MNPAVLMLLLLLQVLAPAQTRPGTISGRVLSVDSTPAANVRVSAMEATEITVAGNTPALVGFSQTDSSGRYRIENLPPGRYYILAGPLEFPSYYPGVPDRAAATAVSVTAGAALDALNFSLSPANQNGMIQVVVQALGTSAPIANAQVSLRRLNAGAGTPIDATTGSDGQVTIGGLLPGTYQVTVQSDGFVGLRGARGRGDQASPSVVARVTVGPEQPEGRIVFSMITGATIEGRALDARGQPVANARGSLTEIGYRDGRRTLVSTAAGNVQTDAQGRYSFTTGPGEYYVRLDIPRVGATARGPAQANAPSVVYYPGVTEVGKAKLLKVGYGDRSSGLDLNVPAIEGVTISGTISNLLSGGRTTPAGAVDRAISSFYMVPRDPGRVDIDVPLLPNTARARTTPGDQTPFELLRIPPGDYDMYPLLADNSSGATSYVTARTPISVRDQNITNLSVALRPKRTLKGKFVVQERVPDIAWETVRLQLRPAEFLPALVLGTGARVVVDSATQEFSADLQESTFNFLITGLPPAVYVADIRQANKSIFGTLLDTRKVDPEPVEIILKSDSATVQGIVRNAGNQQTSTVLLRPATQPQNPLLYKRVLATGPDRFRIVGIAPGDYVLYTFASTPPGGAEENAEFMAKYESRGQRISLRANQVEQVELDRIVDASLSPAEPPPANVPPQVSFRIIRTAAMPIVMAAQNNPQPGARGAGGFGGPTVTPAAPLGRGRGQRSAADTATIDRNLALTPTTPQERAELLSFLLGNGGALINNDRPTAERLLRRGQELDPANSQWPAQLGQLYGFLARFPLALEEYEKALALGLTRILPDAADMARLANIPDKATDYSNRAIATRDPDSVHRGNSTLGLLALEQGDVAVARRYLLASGDVRGSPVLGSFGPNMNLANELLRRGERETVVTYLEQCLVFATLQADTIKGWIAEIKQGNTPTLRSSVGR